MNLDFICSSKDLKVLLLDFKRYCEKYKTLTDKNCLEFISNILKIYDISRLYVESISFEPYKKVSGNYSPKDRSICFNVYELEAAYKLNFLNFEEVLNDYFCLILHEINHILQFRYKNSNNDDISGILRASDVLKIKAGNKYFDYYNLFPDEIDSNVRSAYSIYNMNILSGSEFYLIKTLFSSMNYFNTLITDQFRFLNKNILYLDVNDRFDLLNPLYYGTSKDDNLLDALITSYRTHKLCVDIENGRRF